MELTTGAVLLAAHQRGDRVVLLHLTLGEGGNPKLTPVVPAWKAAVEQYEFAHGVTSGFAYIDYYTALATVRGAIAHKGEAVAFAVDPGSQRRVLDSLP